MIEEDSPLPLPDEALDALRRACQAAWRRRSGWQAEPDRFIRDPGVAEAAAVLDAHPLDEDGLLALLDHAREDLPAGGDTVLAALLLDRLPRLADAPHLREALLPLLSFGPTLVRPLALRLLDRLQGAPPPLLDDVVFASPPAWGLDAHVAPAYARLLAGLLAQGDTLDLARLRAIPDDHPQRAGVPRLLDAVAVHDPDGPAARLAAQLTVQAEAGGYLRVHEAAGAPDPAVVEVPAFARLAGELAAAVEDGRSVAVVGPRGSGRSTVMGMAARILARRGWLVLTGSPDDVAAGQVWVNELEGRLARLAGVCRGRRVVWLAGEFEAAFESGRSARSSRSLADRLAANVREAAPAVLAELSDDGLAALPRESAALTQVLEVAQVPPLGDDDLRAIGRRGLVVPVDDATMGLAMGLARHMLAHLAMPQALVRLLHAAERAAVDRDERVAALTRDDLFAGLTAVTGLPRGVVDDAEPIDLDAVYAWFAGRVLGQPDAVEALVERIALIKAGLTDPARPYGALLFVGPTGTGKTELARALAEYLFGSPERMVRVDMSELQTEDALARLTGTGDLQGAESLATRVRAQPFSVVLLDEFEKAHRNVWDVFLQVLDAGRLTDRTGRTVDFRQAIVIVTTNLGAALDAGRGMGFGAPGGAADPGEGFSPARVERVLRTVLRPELVNRFDRVVVFRPLSREVMRGIVESELRAVLERRGLADRDWAVEVDPSAVELLLEHGFTPDLGARPLRRAVERHLLVPLARAIVSHQAPGGEQFLLVRVADGGGSLDVAFVAADDEPAAPPVPAGLDARDVARDPQGGRAELAVLGEALDRLREATTAPGWAGEKAACLAAMGDAGFWDDPGRFAVMARAEVMDRIEGQLRAGGSLRDRLLGLARDDRVRIPAGPVGRLARELVQLERAVAAVGAGGAQAALVAIAPEGGDDAFARELRGMYLAWARSAGAQARLLTPADARQAVLLLDGLGAHAALAGEAGRHVLERATAGRNRRVAAARVGVAPWAGTPGRDPRQAAPDPAASPEVRRYRRHPSPLVRDRAHGWRTGRLDQVLGGAFDLFH